MKTHENGIFYYSEPVQQPEGVIRGPRTEQILKFLQALPEIEGSPVLVASLTAAEEIFYNLVHKKSSDTEAELELDKLLIESTVEEALTAPLAKLEYRSILNVLREAIQADATTAAKAKNQITRT